MDKVGFAGFLCPKSQKNVPVAFCFSNCKEHCMPLPVLITLANQVRPRTDEWHVTEILNPPQAVWLARNKPWHVAPNSIIDMAIGTAWHEKLDSTRATIEKLGLEDDYIMEKTCKHEARVYVGALNGAFDYTLSGTPDLVIKSKKELWDYKVTKYFYPVKYMMDGKWVDNNYMWQLNIYRTLWYPEVESIKLHCYVKDYKRTYPEKYGVAQSEVVNVPILDFASVNGRIRDLLETHIEAQETGKPRKCREDEMWGGLRCENYCNVSRICPQHQEYLKGIKNEKGKNIRRISRKRKG